jgi:hypothetical protein
MTLKKYILLFFVLTFLYFTACQAQFVSTKYISTAEKSQLEKQQDSLVPFSFQIVNAPEAYQRFRADSFFIRLLVRTLKIPNSFYFPFDSLQSISRLYAPDSSFRIFTWQIKEDDYQYFQRGAIQMRTADGSLKLFPLHDYSTFTPKPADSVRGPNNWIGAIYYRIIQKKYNGENFYTLLGFDDFTVNSNKKWMEVLTFNTQGQPVFGGPYFSFKNDSAAASKYKASRFYIEYKKEAVASFNYDTALNMIIYDHLISESEEPSRRETYVPDGDYEGFTWQNGQWLHVSKVFNTALQDGQFPTDKKILNDDGGINEEMLKQQSDKNKKKAN